MRSPGARCGKWTCTAPTIALLRLGKTEDVDRKTHMLKGCWIALFSFFPPTNREQQTTEGSLRHVSLLWAEGRRLPLGGLGAKGVVASHERGWPGRLSLPSELDSFLNRPLHTSYTSSKQKRQVVDFLDYILKSTHGFLNSSEFGSFSFRDMSGLQGIAPQLGFPNPWPSWYRTFRRC